MIKESTTRHYRKLIDALGRSYVKYDVDSPFDFIHIAKKGISANIVKNFRLYFELSRYNIAQMLNVSEPTLYRRIQSNKIWIAIIL